MLGPVTSAIRPPSPASPERSQSLATKGSPRAASAASTTGWRPPSMRELSERSTAGRVHSRLTASSASAAATSISASAAPIARSIVVARRRSRRSRSKISSSSFSARSAAEAMRASRSISALVVKRIAPAMVWRWMKVASCGGFSSASPAACGVSMKIAEQIVVLDLELADAGLFGIARLHVGDHAPALVAQRAALRRARAKAGAHKAAVALVERQFLGERRSSSCASAPVVAAQLPRRRAMICGGRVAPPLEQRQRQRRRRASRRASAARSRGPPRSSAKPRQRPQEIGGRGEPRASSSRSAAPRRKSRPRRAARRSRGVGQRARQPLGEQPRAGRACW